MGKIVLKDFFETTVGVIRSTLICITWSPASSSSFNNFRVNKKPFVVRLVANPSSRYKPVTTIGIEDVTLYDQFVDKYLAGKVSDLQGGLQGVANQIDKQIQLGA